jgi:choline dehydrogenase
MAVVYPELRVHALGGVARRRRLNLPTIVSGNTNAAAIMSGERAADMGRQKLRLAA